MSSLARLEKYFCSLLYNWLLKEKQAARTPGVKSHHKTLQNSNPPLGSTTRVRTQHPGRAQGGYPTASCPLPHPQGWAFDQTTLLSTILERVLRKTKLKLIFGSAGMLSQSSRKRQEKQVFSDEFWKAARQTSIRLPLPITQPGRTSALPKPRESSSLRSQETPTAGFALQVSV